jgi:hypothetical protein
MPFSYGKIRGIQESEGPRIFRQPAHVGGKVINPKYPLYSPGDTPGAHFC